MDEGDLGDLNFLGGKKPPNEVGWGGEVFLVAT